MHIDANFLTVALAIGGVLATIASMFIDSKIEKAAKNIQREWDKELDEWDKELDELKAKISWLEKKLAQISTHTGFGIDSFIKGKDQL